MFGQRRSIKTTLLAVGEGDSEVAFLKHLRDLYCADGQGVKVTVINAHGKGPEHVIGYAIRQVKVHDYDHYLALLDTDIAWTVGLINQARKFKVQMIGSTPCLEGLLLSILKLTVPEKSLECKKILKKKTTLIPTERQSYQAVLPKPVLEKARLELSDFDLLLRHFEGKRR